MRASSWRSRSSEPRVDVEREDVPAARRPHAERDRHRVLGLVGDRDGDAAHAQLLGAAPRRGRGGTIDGWPVGSRSTSMSFQPTPRTPEAQHLGHGLLGGPATGERLGAVADVALLGGGQDAVGEALPEALDRGRDPVDLDDVDAELGRARRDVPGPRADGSRASPRTSDGPPYSTVTDFARLRGWSTSVPRATAV